ncbi:MAG: glycosyltransferase family 2 protein [Planctomycetota bacterium]|nr:MAG: glycosyltransferase family 2 protein [Planctomycetota bacterium]
MESAPTDERGARAGPGIAVVIPALDEEQALPLVLAELPADSVLGVVVVDNGSTDRTAEVARAGGAYVVYEPRRGYGRACLAGLAAILPGAESPAGVPRAPFGPLTANDVVVFLDADHSDYPADLPRVVAPILAGEADLVIGSRVLGGATMQALLPQAWIGNRIACGLMQLLFGARYTDLGPFRAITVSALEHLGMHDVDFGWTVEMQLKARVARLRVVEVPVRYRARIGQSKITGTVSGTVRAGWKILGWIVGWRLKLLVTSGRIPRYTRPAPHPPVSTME